ncbi:SgrR family transcriptional regulator [Paenibacillus sp. D51F]
MIETERYLILYDRFSTGSALGTPVEVALEELAEALRCTTRNVKLILKKLEEDHCLRPFENNPFSLSSRSVAIMRLE